ncbi:T9SS type A sorting domain-containing protein [Bacteroidota bacterium]
MRNLILAFSILLSFLLYGDVLGQDKPLLTGQSAVNNPSTSLSVIYDQMDNPGAGSITSQNFEAANDINDSFAADDFALMDVTWSIMSVDVIGAYFNGSGPATSVNVWFYSSNGAGGLPVDTVYTALNVIPSAGLADGSFSIPLPVPAVLNEGWYWLCVQANMDLITGGQWGWTERTAQWFSESAWKNPGGGWGTICTPSWGYRVSDCGVDTDPDNCFRLNGDIVPVELNSFSAINDDNEVKLNWSTATETNNLGFEIERLLQDSQFENIAYVPGWGTTTEMHYYSYIDKGLTAGKYSYRLKQIDFNGSFEYSKVVEVEITAPYEYSLSQNYPNPFNPSTLISYELPISGIVTLKVSDILGNEVETLVNEEKPAGTYEITWLAENLPSGIYFYRLQAADYVQTKKMVLMK